MKFHLFLYNILFLCSFQAYAQTEPSIDSIEMSLVELQREYRHLIFDDYEQAVLKGDSFTKNLIHCLKNNASLKHPFDSLKTEIRIISSIDKKLRVFSWDTEMGGTWHSFVSYLQYKGGNQLKVQQLHSGFEMEKGGYTDVIYYKIKNFEHKKGRIYLLFGFGTHGAGHHHKIVRAFRKEGNRLVELENVFDGEQQLVIVAPRRNNIGVEFERTGLKLIFDEFVYSDDIGFSEATGMQITYAWNGHKFIRL